MQKFLEEDIYISETTQMRQNNALKLILTYLNLQTDKNKLENKISNTKN
jgi:hypothetical protein